MVTQHQHDKKYSVAWVPGRIVGNVGLAQADYHSKKTLTKALNRAQSSLRRRRMLIGFVDPDSGEVVELISLGLLEQLQGLEKENVRLRQALVAAKLVDATDEYQWDDDSLPNGPEGPSPAF